MTKENKKAPDKKPVFTKEQLLRGKAFAGRKDLLRALLRDDGLYTKAQVEEKMRKFAERRVD